MSHSVQFSNSVNSLCFMWIKSCLARPVQWLLRMDNSSFSTAENDLGAPKSFLKTPGTIKEGSVVQNVTDHSKTIPESAITSVQCSFRLQQTRREVTRKADIQKQFHLSPLRSEKHKQHGIKGLLYPDLVQFSSWGCFVPGTVWSKRVK